MNLPTVSIRDFEVAGKPGLRVYQVPNTRQGVRVFLSVLGREKRKQVYAAVESFRPCNWTRATHLVEALRNHTIATIDGRLLSILPSGLRSEHVAA